MQPQTIETKNGHGATEPTGPLAFLKRACVPVVRDGGRVRFALAEALAALAESREDGRLLWERLLSAEPELTSIVQPKTYVSADGSSKIADSVDIEGVVPLSQSVRSRTAERVKRWLARAARQRLEESGNPELAALRARRLYERKGHDRRWIDQRLRGISARHELVGEWHKRGVRESDQFRGLTNELMHGAFGMDVEGLRRYKRLTGANQHLRDHMSDLELALTALGETVAVTLHRSRDSRGCAQLAADAKDAGEIVAVTRTQIEQRSGRAVMPPGPKVPPVPSPVDSGRSHPGQMRDRNRVADAVSHGRDAGEREVLPTSS
jgi:DNA-damage-inducible protein D